MIPTIFRHFKGGYYLVLNYSQSVDDNTRLVVYQSLGDGKIWSRKIEDFFSEIDPCREDNVFNQPYRFMKVEIDGSVSSPFISIECETQEEEQEENIKSDAFYVDYVVGYFNGNTVFSNFIPCNYADTLYEANDKADSYSILKGRRPSIIRREHYLEE